LEPIAEMADRLRIAVVAITHLNKNAGSNQGALERFQGSIAFIAAARAGFAVIRDEENEGRSLFLQVKNNLAPMRGGLAFCCQEKIVGDGIVTSTVAWEKEYVTRSADEALSATEQGTGAKSGTATHDAVDFLKAVLGTDEVRVLDLEREARQAGLLSERQTISQCKSIRTARKILNVKSKKLGMDQGWVWHIPLKMPSNPEDALPKNGASSGPESIFRVFGGNRG
jgi:putative DNA primase/helicase